MEKFKLFLILVAVSLLNSVPALASSYYEWTTSGTCYEFTPSGTAIREVNISTCREANGSFYEWTNSGTCYEFTPSGTAIREVNLGTCRGIRGSRYEWTTSGRCYEFTPSGTAIREVNLSTCRDHSSKADGFDLNRLLGSQGSTESRISSSREKSLNLDHLAEESSSGASSARGL